MLSTEREKGFEPSTSTLARWPAFTIQPKKQGFVGAPLGAEHVTKQRKAAQRLTRRHGARHGAACGFVVLLLGLLTATGCGGTIDAPAPADASPDVAQAQDGASPEAAAEAGQEAGDACWRCADRAWRNVCVVPATVAPDAESCLHCGEHCVSDAGGE